MIKRTIMISVLFLMSLFCYSVDIDMNGFLSKLDSEGYVRVIVKIDVPGIKELTARSTAFGVVIPGAKFPEEGLEADRRLKEAIHMTAGSILDCLNGMDYQHNYTFETIPYIALRVSPEALEHLKEMPQVLGIELDALSRLPDYKVNDGAKVVGKSEARTRDIVPPLLNNTVKIVGADDVWAMGYTGSGWYVAILDTGIRRTHQFFTGKTIREACFSNSSHCPNGSTSQYGTGSAAHYASTYEGYDHGTHVAGIAAGNYGSLAGVAKSANIIAVQVFSKFGPSDCDGGYCVLTWNTDQLKALEYIYTLRNTYSIGAVNMSLGGGSYSAYCDSDSRKTAIDNLKAAKIGVAIATGNNGYCGYIGSPSCISSAIAVGSVTEADAEASYNNWHATLQELFAPGSTIYSSTGDSDSSYESWNGTSMATPHVTGALTLLRSYSPTSTVNTIYSALRSTGKKITSPCNTAATGIPRIQIEKALAQLPGTTTPTITVTSPNGGENWTVGSSRTITWTSTGTVGNVKIIYTTNNGSSWINIISSTANDGSYTWTVPNTTSSQCKVLVKEASDGAPSDSSNSTFSITTASSGNPVIALNRTSLYFGGISGSTTSSSQELWVTNSGTGTMTWTGTDSASWLSISPTSNSGSAIVTVTANPTGLAAGTYTGTITITCSAASNSPRTVNVTLTVKNSNQNAAPFGELSTPANGATLQSSIPVTGWALDDIGLSSVKIYAVKNNTQYEIGTALQVPGARPDVLAAYPTYPGAYKAGWGYMLLTYFLPGGGTGTYTLKAIATDLAGKQATLGSVVVTVKNSTAVKPFGAIDTPAPGGVASGTTFKCDGWALTPPPNTIPTNGSTILVQVDGVTVGSTAYNIYRSDIANLFPGYNNANGAYAYKFFNTKNYSNGLHSIQWVASDNAGNGDGIGSRYFVIMNAVTSREAESQNASPSADTLSQTIPSPEIPSQHLDNFISMKPTGRIAGRVFQNAQITDAWLILNNEKHPLPVGSTLDKKNASFFWHPGPAFNGEFPILFQGVDSNGQLIERTILFNLSF